MINTVATLTIEQFVDQLLIILDKDIVFLEANIECLNELRKLVVKQDTEALSQLLGRIRTASPGFRENERKRQIVRQNLAGLLGCDTKRVTLSRIIEALSEEKKAEVNDRKQRLQSLGVWLKKEYMSTQMLLIDCERFNRMLLNTVFQAGRSSSGTYSPTGSTQRQTDTVFMNVQF